MSRVTPRRTPARTALPAKRGRAAPRRLRPSGGASRRFLRWWTRHLRMFTAGIAVVAAIGGGIFLYVSGAATRLADDVEASVTDAVAAAGFRVEEVAVSGRARTDPAAVLASLSVTRGEPILGFDPAEAREALIALPWVKDAVVQRRLPDSIHVTLTERQPLALWQQDRRYFVVDAEGEVLVEDASRDWFSLPLIVGDGAPDAALSHLRLLGQAPAVAQRTRASVRVGSRRWDLHLDSGIVVQLPERPEAEAQAIARLGRFLTDEAIDQYDVVRVDLRLEDRMVIETATPPGQEHELPGENT